MHKRFLVLAALCIAAFVPAASLAAGAKPHAAHAKPLPPPKVAPADEYFGRMKMSILGITNTIKDTGLREGFDPANAGKYYGGLAFTEDALEDWAHKYPQDSWIPRRAYDMSHDFWLMHTPQADAEAQRCRAVLFKHFAHNHWAVIARSETAARVAAAAASSSVANAPGKQP